MGTSLVSAETFLEQRFEYPEAGQWSELEQGVVVHLQPPDLDHGNVVLNLSKAFADFAHASQQGYACFDLGLQLGTDPDTVRFPAACYFASGPRFAASDKLLTSAVPALVVELASTSDRQRQQPERSLEYLRWGVPTVWTIETRERSADVYQPSADIRRVNETEWLSGEGVLAQLRIPVSALFTVPAWWSR